MSNWKALWTSAAVVAVATVVGIAGILGAADEPKTDVKKDTLTIEGSTTVGPISDAYAEYFQKQNPGLKITVKNTGSSNGITALLEGRCDICTASRFMKLDEFKKAVDKGIMPVAHVIAMDGVCIIVNPANTVDAKNAKKDHEGLTKAEIRDIYLGKIKNWKDLGGPDMEIVVVSRDTSSGTYEAFNELVMNKEKMAEGVQYVSSNQEVHDKVKTTKGAVGYVGLGFVDKDVKGLCVDGVVASKKTIVSGKYPISRPLFMFTNGYPAMGSLIFEIVTFHLTEAGQKIVEAKGYVPVTNY